MAFDQVPIDAGLGFSKHSELVVGRVTNVVLSQYLDKDKTKNLEYTSPADIGKIIYAPLYKNKQVSLGKNASRPAWPLFSFMKQYPVIGELVLIVLGPTREANDNVSAMQAYYFPSFNVWNSVNNNCFPDMNEYADFIREYYQKPGYRYNATTPIPELPKGYYFREKEVYNLTPFEGDTIIEGRFGQSIRFGSTSIQKNTENNWSNFGKDGDPITIIRNGQGKNTKPVSVDVENPLISILPDQPTIENINYDHSSIYLTSTQEIFIEDVAKGVFPLASYGDVKVLTNQSITRATVTNLSQNPISNQSISPKDTDSMTFTSMT